MASAGAVVVATVLETPVGATLTLLVVGPAVEGTPSAHAVSDTAATTAVSPLRPLRPIDPPSRSPGNVVPNTTPVRTDGSWPGLGRGPGLSVPLGSR